MPAKIYLLFAAISLSSCIHRPMVDAAECPLNEFCKAQGRLSMVDADPGWFGVLDGKTNCMILALPEGVQNEHALLDQKSVVVTGVVREHPRAEGMVSWYEVNGRPITSHRCTSRYMWVDKVELAGQ